LEGGRRPAKQLAEACPIPLRVNAGESVVGLFGNPIYRGLGTGPHVPKMLVGIKDSSPKNSY
jgi:hypothetical protein